MHIKQIIWCQQAQIDDLTPIHTLFLGHKHLSRTIPSITKGTALFPGSMAALVDGPFAKVGSLSLRNVCENEC